MQILSLFKSRAPLLATLLALPFSASAQSTSTANLAIGKYGCEFHAGAGALPAGRSIEDSEYQALLSTAAELQTQLIQQDRGSGIWTEERARLLLEMASTNRAMGNNEEARQQYEDALHNRRVNEGLYSLDPLPVILDLMAWSMAEDPEFIDRMGDRADFLLERHYDDEEQIPDLVLWYGKLLRLRQQAQAINGNNRDAEPDKTEVLAQRITALLERLFNSDNTNLLNRLRGDVNYYSAYDALGNQLTQLPADATQISFTTGVVLESVQSLLQPPFEDSQVDLNRAKDLLDNLQTRYASLPDPDKAAMWDFYASYYLTIGDNSSAITAYSQMLEVPTLRPDYQLRALRAIGQLYEQEESWNESVAAYSCWSRLSQSHDPRVSLGLGNAQYQLGNHVAAISNLNAHIELLEIQEETPAEEVYLLLKEMYYETDDFDAAEDVTRTMVRLFGDNRK